MDSERVDKILDRSGYSAHLRPLNGKHDDKRATGWYVCGFDSEFANEGNNLISYQLYGENEDSILIAGPERRSLYDIACEAQKLGGYRSKKVLIVSHFNTAELGQVANPFWAERPFLKYYQVHPRGIYHVEGRTDGKIHTATGLKTCKFEFLYFDLWHFFASMRGSSSLYDIAERFGYQKLKYDVTHLTLDALQDPAFVAYALRDAELCVRIFTELDKTYREVSNVSIIARPTPANAALSSFRRNYLPYEIKAAEPDVRKLALQSDWAGRVECGFVGEMDNVHEFDADSLYPRSTLLLPNLPTRSDWNRSSSFLPDDEKVEGFAEVEFSFPQDEEWPCLPVFRNGALYFPITGLSFCTIGEIRAAQERGASIRIHRAYFYREGTCSAFHDFIKDNIKLKEQNEDNEAIRAVAKLNMNSSIGKLVQNKGGINYGGVSQWLSEHSQDYEDESTDIALGYLRPLPFKELFKTYRRDIRLGSGFYPEWHSLILGKAREVVARAIYSSPSYPRILMVSTDSLHQSADSMGATLVRFKHEYGPAYFKAIRSRIHLLHDGTKTLKMARHGIPRVLVNDPDITPNEYVELLIMASKSLQEKKVLLRIGGFQTLRESALAGQRFGSYKTRNIMVDFRPDTKRRVDQGGFTHPLRQVA